MIIGRWYVQLAGIWHWLYNQHVLALCALLTGVILKGPALRKCVSDVCIYVCFVFAKWLVLWIDLTDG